MSTSRTPRERASRYPELTTHQASLVAKVKPVTVRMWVLRGHVKRTRPGFIDAESLLTYLDNRSGHGMQKGQA